MEREDRVRLSVPTVSTNVEGFIFRGEDFVPRVEKAIL